MCCSHVTPGKEAYFFWHVQAVALGAAIQAGLYEGSVSGLMVIDIWQASLLRALATKRLKDDSELAQEVLGNDLPDETAADNLDDDFDDNDLDDKHEELT